MQAPSTSGLTPAQDEERFSIMPIHSANDKLAESLKATWAERTPKEARKHLENRDVTVTNKSDKEKQANLPPLPQKKGPALCHTLALKLSILSISCCSQLPKLIEMHEEVAKAFKDTQVEGKTGWFSI